MKLQLSLKKQWFELTKTGIKTEDYREITEYWCRRLLQLKEDLEFGVWLDLIEDLGNPNRPHIDVQECLEFYNVTIKQFDTNIMTLGYPSKTDTERILKLKHKGIEIRTGNPEWGAEPNKLYFVIKHGEIVI